jgi:hypothetical protein
VVDDSTSRGRDAGRKGVACRLSPVAYRLSWRTGDGTGAPSAASGRTPRRSNSNVIKPPSYRYRGVDALVT